MIKSRYGLFSLALSTFLLMHSTAASAAGRGGDVPGAVGCPVRSHDVVVSNITALREAVDIAPPGTVIGVDGIINVDDGLGDILVFTDGIQLTCASEGAAIIGEADFALIQFFGYKTQISNLIVTATAERAVVFFGDRPTAIKNTIQCVRTCILVIDSQNAVVKQNDISQGEQSFGIAAVGGARNISIKENVVANCSSTCIVMQAEDSEVVGNRVWNTFKAVEINSSGVRVTKNEVSDCELCITAGFEVNHVEIKKNRCNSPTGSSCLQVNGINDHVLIEDNHVVGNVIVNNGGLLGYVTNFVFRDNSVEQGTLAFESLTGGNIEGNHLSSCAGEGPFGTCMSLLDSTLTTVQDNTIVGGPRDYLGIGVSNLDPGHSVSIIGNDLALAPDPGFGWDAGAQGMTLSGDNFFVEDNSVFVFSEAGQASGIDLNGFVYSETLRINGVVAYESSVFEPSRANHLGGNAIETNGTGILLNGVCDSTLIDNDLEDNPIGIFLTLSGAFTDSFTDPYTNDLFEFTISTGGTGANTVSTDDDTVVLEEITFSLPSGATLVGDGYLDCDGDGNTDPNFLSVDD